MANHKLLTVRMLLLGAGLAAFRPAEQPSAFTIEVVNIEKNRGKVVVELYNDKAGWLLKPFRRLALAPDAGALTASFAVPRVNTPFPFTRTPTGTANWI
jgi:uncharacterized protein (DUF2141 family)